MKNKVTKRALVVSALAVLACVALLVGSTFAWFTDNVTSAGNVIQSGILDVDLVDAQNASMAGQIIEFKTVDNRAQDEILWEPGCTYETESLFVVNNGNLALKYEFAINGIYGDAQLNDVITWTVKIGGVETTMENFNGFLLPDARTGAIVIEGHMDEDAGNEYQNLTVSGISIVLTATQYTKELDSFGKEYDAVVRQQNG